MDGSGITTPTIFHLGPLLVTETTTTTWGIMVGLTLAGLLIRRNLREDPGPFQVAAEGIVGSMEDAVREVAPQQYRLILPFVMSLWIFLIVANLVGLIPGLHSPTRDFSATASLAILVFLAVHWFGIRSRGVKEYLRHYLSPSPILLPFHLISEITRTIALAVRLFGNIMSMEMIALLLLLVAGFLAPIPILMLHIIEALVQAYIFGMLALTYIAGGLQSQELRRENAPGKEQSDE
jgi:F-type H+-transporting ATPase subunit a